MWHIYEGGKFRPCAVESLLSYCQIICLNTVVPNLWLMTIRKQIFPMILGSKSPFNSKVMVMEVATKIIVWLEVTT